MPTLYELILNHPDVDEVFKGFLRNALIVNADNVAEYYFVANEKDAWDICDDFPNIAPPFQKLFIEYRVPKYMVADGNIKSFSEAWDRVGIYFFSQDTWDINYTGVGKGLENGPRWLVESILFCENNGHLQFFFGEPWMMAWNFCVRENGEIWVQGSGPDRMFLTLRMPPQLYQILLKVAKWEMNRDGGNLNRSYLDVALLTFSFMHCKNVQFVPKGAGVNKGKRNRHGPHVRYHILEIEPMKKILRTEGKSEETGLKKALHICRGHFKDYRESGLFGRNKGIYWWDAHTRGSLSEGVVGKDYLVNLGSE